MRCTNQQQCIVILQEGNLCALNLLSVANLVNYFGKPDDIENISISPILLRKGSTQLALYGMGSVRDERLHRLFLRSKVKCLRPKEQLDDWFNIFMLHQNRYSNMLRHTVILSKLTYHHYPQLDNINHM